MYLTFLQNLEDSYKFPQVLPSCIHKQGKKMIPLVPHVHLLKKYQMEPARNHQIFLKGKKLIKINQ